jgi:hypothetical protein
MTAKEVFEQYKDGLISLGELLVWCSANSNLLTPLDTQAVLLATVGTLKRDMPIVAMATTLPSLGGIALTRTEQKKALDAVRNLRVDQEALICAVPVFAQTV